MAKGRNLLGLDIGASSIKACLLKDTKRGLGLQVFDTVELPDEAIVEGAVMNAGVVVDAVRELTSRNRIRQKDCALSVAGYSVIIKKVTLPLMTREELDESIQWEAEQYIPFDIADVYLDSEILAHKAAQGQMDVLLVAAKKETVNEYTQVAREAGLNPVIMDVQACCLQNVFEANYGAQAAGQTSVLIDVGSALTNINVLSDGATTFTRDIAMAGSLFTEEIQKQLNITYEEAEAYKRGGQGGGAGVVPEAVENVLQQVSEVIAAEVQRSLDFYAATSADSVYSRIYLSGGSARIPALGRTISRMCGVSVELLNPFAAIAYDEKTFSPAFLQQVAPSAGVAVGLSLRRSNES